MSASVLIRQKKLKKYSKNMKWYLVYINLIMPLMFAISVWYVGYSLLHNSETSTSMMMFYIVNCVVTGCCCFLVRDADKMGWYVGIIFSGYYAVSRSVPIVVNILTKSQMQSDLELVADVTGSQALKTGIAIGSGLSTGLQLGTVLAIMIFSVFFIALFIQNKDFFAKSLKNI